MLLMSAIILDRLKIFIYHICIKIIITNEWGVELWERLYQ